MLAFALVVALSLICLFHVYRLPAAPASASSKIVTPDDLPLRAQIIQWSRVHRLPANASSKIVKIPDDLPFRARHDLLFRNHTKIIQYNKKNVLVDATFDEFVDKLRYRRLGGDAVPLPRNEEVCVRHWL